MKAFAAHVFSTFFGIGHSPFAPGTMGAIAATIIYWYFLPSGGLVWFLALIAITLIGVGLSSITEKEFQQKSGDSNAHDPGIIVLDEVAGVLFALFGMGKQWPWVLAALILFRIFDILKPFPVKQFEKLPGGWGIMMDDVVAGIIANVILRIALLFLR
ncbi:MAG: phosphatidylglycerophosphatase A [Calditrichaeota bacterium]|nr:phosphatidylglycerophosphatase A [Calditrichota bacterium]